MKTLKFENKEDWFKARSGKITGTRLKDIVVKRGIEEKLGFYELIAERIAIPPDGEDPMERGSRLEETAIKRFSKETGKKVNTELVIWEREDNPNIAVSPDGFIGKTEAIDAKCLSSSRHIQAFITQTIPDEYYFQFLQYFIVNDQLKTLYVAFYDDRVTVKEFFYLEMKKKDYEEEIQKYLEYQKEKLEKVEEIVKELTKF